MRRRRGAHSPEGYHLDSFEYAGVAAALLEPLGPGGNRAPDDAVLIMDGVFLLRPELRRYWDFSVFVRAESCATVVVDNNDPESPSVVAPSS